MITEKMANVVSC